MSISISVLNMCNSFLSFIPDYLNRSANCTADKVGEDIAPCEGRVHQCAKQRIVADAEKLGIVKILTRFNQTGEDEHPQRKKPYFVGNEYSYEAPKKNNHKHITKICSDKIRKVKLRDEQLTYKKQDEHEQVRKKWTIEKRALLM